MLINRATSVDVLPLVKLSDKKFIELVEETKLLGIMIRSDLSWKSNTNALVTKGLKRIWMMRNLKKYGANDQHLVEVYIQQVRSILAYGLQGSLNLKSKDLKEYRKQLLP